MDFWVHEHFVVYNIETLTKIYGQKVIAVSVVVHRGYFHHGFTKKCCKNHCPHTV